MRPSRRIGAILVQPPQQFGDGRVQLGQAVELPIAQSRQYPALDDENRGLDLRLVARSMGSGRQHGGAVMRRHFGIGSVDLRLVQAGLDDGDLGVVGHEQARHAADRREGAGVRADPVPERLGPARLGIGEVRGAHDRDEDLRLAHLAGQPVDDHRHGVAGIIDEQLVAADMGLAHRDRDPAFPASVELAETGVAVALRVVLDVFVPEDRQRDVLALELPMDGRPVGLDLSAVTLLGAGLGEQRGFERGVGESPRAAASSARHA